MACYNVEVKKSARKALLALPSNTVQNLTRLIDSLSENPYPSGCKKLKGSVNSYRVRHGDYRVIYSVFDNRLIVQVVKIGHRKDIYR